MKVLLLLAVLLVSMRGGYGGGVSCPRVAAPDSDNPDIVNSPVIDLTQRELLSRISDDGDSLGVSTIIL